MTIKITGEDEVVRKPLMSLGDKEPIHSEEFTGAQANRLHLALGESSPGVPELSSSLSSGTSEQYRRLLADSERIQKVKAQNEVLQSILQADREMITPEIVSVVQGLSMQEMQEPDLGSIIEKKYAEIYTGTAVSSLENEILEESFDADPETTYDLMDRAEGMAFKKQYAMSKLDEAEQAVSNQSWTGTVWNFAENMALGSYQQYDQVEKDFVEGILPGQNKMDQYAYMWGLGPEEFKAELDRVTEDLKSRNPYSLQQWLTGLFSYGNNDALLDSAFAVADLAGVVPVGRFAKALKGVTKASHLNPSKVPEIATQLGKHDDAAVGQVIEDLKSNEIFTQNIRDISKTKNILTSISDPLKLLEGSQGISQASYLRLKEALFNRSDLIGRFLIEPNLIDRLQPEELLKYKDILLRDYEKVNPSVQKNVIDVEVADRGDLGNVYQAKILLGRRDGTLFESEAQAKLYFEKYIGGTDDYQIVQKGQGFQIEVLKTVDETKIASEVRLGTSQRTPESVANTFGGWWRSGRYLVSEQAVGQRSVAVSSHELMNEIFDDISAPFKDIPKKELSELQDLMVDNRQKGEYFKNYGEFEQAFFTRHKKLPTEKQADTYFAYVQINDLDMMIRDLDVYKQKTRMGLEKFSIPDVDQEIVFEGKVVDDLPYGSRSPFRVTVVDDEGHVSKSVFSKYLGENDRAFFTKLREEGYKIIQVADQNLELSGNHTGFLVTKNFKRGRIGLGNFERKPGGHKVHLYPFYIKQGRFSSKNGENLYKGDTSLWNFRSEKEASDAMKILEEFRQKFISNDPSAMKFLRDNFPGISMKHMAAMIKDGTIDLKIPFAVTKRGSRTLDTGAYSNIENLVDLSKNEHNLMNQVRGRYLGERSESDLGTIRSEEDTLFQVEEAPYLSPLDTLRVSSANMLSTRLESDYSISARQNFLREFGDILEGTKEEQASSGFGILSNPKFKEGVDKLPNGVARMSAAQNVSRAYNQFMRIGTEWDNKVESVKERILMSVMPKFGPRGQQWVERRLLTQVKDPGVYLRSVAFDFKMGMFNVKQYFVQLNTMVNINTIAGTKGVKGTLAFPLMRYALWSNGKDVLNRTAKIAQSTGLMPAKDFEESINLLRRSGWNNIGGDVAYLDDISGPEFRKSRLNKVGGKILQWGRTPFYEGERTVRLAAWMTAYLERKALRNGGTLSKADETQILVRAKTLTTNMTRESNAGWQKGYWAVVSQFFGYQARLMEQFLGKELTGMEKTRLFAAYSMVYGAPVATGAVAGVVPVREMIRDYLYETGQDPDNTAWEPFIDGFASAFWEYMTGRDLNIASRYGPGGLPTFYDLLRGDKEFADIALGAGGGVLLTTLSDSLPMIRAMNSEWFQGEGGMYNLTKEDFWQPLRNISTVDDLVKLYEVYNLGIWASKNGTNLTEMDLPDAYTAVLTGLQPGRLEDSFSRIRGMKGIKEYKEKVRKEVIVEYRRMMNMDPGKDREVATRRIVARMIAAGFTEREMRTAWRYAFDTEMMTDSVLENYEKIIGDMK